MRTALRLARLLMTLPGCVCNSSLSVFLGNSTVKPDCVALTHRQGVRVVRAALPFLLLFCHSLNSAEAPEFHRRPKPFLIAVNQPAFAGEPIWVNEITRPTPYSYVGGECNRLELLHNGKPVPRWSVKPVFLGGGGSTPWPIISSMHASDCIREAIYNPSPGKRIPLHIWFHIQQPGRYALRWNYEWPEFQGNKPVMRRVSSAWITFTVRQLSAEDREKWLRHLLANPAESAVDLATDYIPSLVAAAPDERALHAIAAQLYSDDQLAAEAAEALAFFPEDRVRATIFELIQKQGPTGFLAHLVSWNTFGLDVDPNQRAAMTRTCFSYLRSSDPWKVAAAIEMVMFNVHGKHQVPTDPKLIAQADNEVLDAAEAIANAGQADPQREMILYMRSINTPEVRQRLTSMAHSKGAAADLANTALLFDHAPEASGPLLLEVKERSNMPHEFKTARSYGLTITNLTGSPAAIQRGIAVERKTPKGWKQETAIQAVATCVHYHQGYNWKSPIRLAARSSLAVYPWDGFLCGGQCEDACMQNGYSGPGIFRFVVVLLPDGKRIASLPFAISGR